jgi:hypothetical protein
MSCILQAFVGLVRRIPTKISFVLQSKPFPVQKSDIPLSQALTERDRQTQSGAKQGTNQLQLNTNMCSVSP